MLLLLECQCHMNLTINYTTFHRDLKLHYYAWHLVHNIYVLHNRGSVYMRKRFNCLRCDNNIAAVSLLWNTNMAPTTRSRKRFQTMSRTLPSKNVSVKNKKTILCTNHLSWKENSLETNDWDLVQLSRESCHQFPQRNMQPQHGGTQSAVTPPKTIIVFE